MREIKFRAWEKSDHIMHYDILDNYNLDVLLKSDNWSIMQYTGLKDKNGKEIYEGDIVNLIPLGYMNDGAIVMWSEQEGCWIYQRIYNETDIYAYKWGEVEVIGNICENPELLKGANHA